MAVALNPQNPFGMSNAQIGAATLPGSTLLTPKGLATGGNPDKPTVGKTKVGQAPVTAADIANGTVLPTHLTPKGLAVGKVKAAPVKAAPKSAPKTKPDPPGKSGYPTTGPNPPAGTPPVTDPGGGSSSDIASIINGLYGGALTTQQLAALAGSQASGDIASQVNNYITQQGQDRAQGKSMADTILEAATQAAHLNAGIPNAINQNASTDANTLGSIANAFASKFGNLSNTDFESLGQSLPPGATLRGAGGLSPATILPGALSAIAQSGQIPAHSLLAQGLAAASAARELPSELHGAGTQEALLAQGAGNQAANRLNANISNVESQLPTLTQKYLSSLSTQQMNALKDKVATAIAISKANGTPFQWASLNANIGEHNATLNENFNKPVHFGDSKSGYYIYDPATGKTTQLYAPVAGGAKAATVSQLNTLGQEVKADGRQGYQVRTVNGTPKKVVDPNKSPVSISTEVTKVMSRTGWSQPVALSFVLSNSDAYREVYQNALDAHAAATAFTT